MSEANGLVVAESANGDAVVLAPGGKVWSKVNGAWSPKLEFPVEVFSKFSSVSPERESALLKEASTSSAD